MTASAWIAAAGLGFTIISAAVYVGRIVGALPGQMAAAVREHERGCSNYDPNSTVRRHPIPGACEPSP
jgi:hypothetical protein